MKNSAFGPPEAKRRAGRPYVTLKTITEETGLTGID